MREEPQNRACSHGNSAEHRVGLCLPLTAEARRTLPHEVLPESGAVPPIRHCIKPNPLSSERDLSLGMNSDDRHPPLPTGRTPMKPVFTRMMMMSLPGTFDGSITSKPHATLIIGASS
ncbi:hypothetical protein QQF64_008151 [Cirrhinus molitorella]|uniref:Uncharacterized protein n=2 Tax=Cirrhinus molitorella TaxID=172907 RepID=A0ABR3M8R0_9TELE|nr:hypothetical protein Q8A67_018980 [Cirrhinus molitorella]